MIDLRTAVGVIALAAAAQAQPAFTLRIAVLSQEQAPGTGPGVVYSSFSSPVLNASGEMLFRASLQGPGVNSTNDRGLWRLGPAGLAGGGSMVLRAGDTVPASVGTGTWEDAPDYWLADNGSITAFTWHSPSPGVGRPSLLSINANQFSVIINQTSHAPPVPPGAIARWATSQPYSSAARANGRAVTQMQLEGAGFPSTQDSGLWTGTPASVSTVATTRSTLPGPTPFSVIELGPGRVNSSGDVAFYARSEGMIGGFQDEAVWRWRDGAAVPVLRTGDPAPGIPGATFSGAVTKIVPINDAGQVIVRGVFRNSPTLPTEGRGVWVGEPGNLSLVARRGQQAPGTQPGLTFGEIHQPILGEGGHVAFAATLEQAPTHTDTGLWLRSPGGQVALVAREYDVVPDQPDPNVIFSSSFNPILNAQGMLVVRAQLGRAGTTLDLGPALFAKLPGQPLQKIVMKGDSVEVSPGVFRTVSFLELFTGGGDPDPGFITFTDSGLLAFRASFTDGTSAIMTSLIPAPGTATLALLAGAGAARRRRHA